MSVESVSLQQSEFRDGRRTQRKIGVLHNNQTYACQICRSSLEAKTNEEMILAIRTKTSFRWAISPGNSEISVARKRIHWKERDQQVVVHIGVSNGHMVVFAHSLWYHHGAEKDMMFNATTPYLSLSCRRERLGTNYTC
jgi:hypothetical protein